MTDVQDALVESDVCKAIYTLARIDLWVYCLQLEGTVSAYLLHIYLG